MTTTTPAPDRRASADPRRRRAVGLPPQRRSQRFPVVLIVGIVLIAAGAFAAGGAFEDDSTAPAEVGVLYAAAPIAPGTTGEELRDGLVEVREPDAERDLDVLGSDVRLDGLVVAEEIPAGAPIHRSDLRAMTARERAIEIPAGTEAIAVTLAFTPAGGGYVGPGDRVNVYVADSAEAVATDGPARLLLADVEVLDVSVEVAPYRSTASTAAAGSAESGGEVVRRSTGGEVTMLLAVPSPEVTGVVQAARSAQLHVSLLGEAPR